MPAIGVKLKDKFPKDKLKVDNITLSKGKYTYLNSKIVKDTLTPYKNFIDFENETPPKSLGKINKEIFSTKVISKQEEVAIAPMTVEEDSDPIEIIETEDDEVVKDSYSAVDVEASDLKTKVKDRLKSVEEVEDDIQDLEKIIPEEKEAIETDEVDIVEEVEEPKKSKSKKGKKKNEDT